MEKTFDAQAAEARIYKTWEDANAFEAGANKSRDESFVIMAPPPNVTGVLHIGHAFNNTLQDILVRWKRMQGYDVLWQPGQDHAGIATQLMVEKHLAQTEQPKRMELGREAFLSKVWEWKAQSGGTIVEQLKRLGVTMDWSRNAFTMSGAPNAPSGEDGNFHDAVLKVFVKMYDDGLIYRGKRLVNWDPHFETAISDLEVENIEVDGHMWHFKYPLEGGVSYTYVEKDEDGNVVLEEERDYISIATTRPETMLGDGAIAVHPSDERYAPIVGKRCEVPVGPKGQRRLIPIITDEYPDKDFGSGAVKITGAHDFNDYQVAKRAGLAMYSLMDSKGVMRNDGAPYAEQVQLAERYAMNEEPFSDVKIAAVNLVPEAYRGMDRFEARTAVIRDVTAEGLAVMIQIHAADEDGNDTVKTVPLVEAKKIMQPFGDRSKVVIEPMLTDQWFVDTDKIVSPALDAVKNGDVKIIPDSGEKVYYHWLENIEPWCISRQLWWGHQIPVWYGPSVANDALDFDTPKAFCGTSFDEIKARATKYYGQDVSECESFLHAQEAAETAKIALYRDPDVLDTWFSSGLWPFGTLGWPDHTPELEKYFSTDVLITGQDILFFWVARMMMMSHAVMEENPFHTIYLHQLLRDERGEKMSKTRGNVIDPLVVIDEFGADALRFTMAQMAAVGGVLKLSESRITTYRNFGTKLWNAFSFAEHYEIPNSGQTSRPTPKQTLNRWIIGETAKTLDEVNVALETYRFNDAANALYSFIWGTVCDWYVEFSKPILQGDDTKAQQETQHTLRWVLDQCLILLHPIKPFITEELWALADQRGSLLVHAPWPTYTASDLVDTKADSEMNWVISLIEGIRSARAQVRVPASAKVPVLVQDWTAASQSAWTQNAALIQRLARIETLEVVDTFPKGCVTIAVDGATFGIPLAGLIDISAETTRLEKSLMKIEKEMGGLKGRLNNAKFIASAPAEVVEEAKANLALRDSEKQRLSEALSRLQELG